MENKSTQEAPEETCTSDSESESWIESPATDLDDEDYQYSSGDEDSDEEVSPLPLPSASPRSSSPPPSPTASCSEKARSHHVPATPLLPTTSTISTPKDHKSPSRGRSRRSRGRKRSRSHSRSSSSKWNSEQDPDTYSYTRRFTPKRKPGHQLHRNGSYTPLDLFSLFLDRSAIINLCTNTNKRAAKSLANGKKYTWTKLQETELYKFIGLTFYFSLVKLSAIVDYWKQNSIFSQALPPKVMTRERFRTISWNIHMSDPDQDVENNKKKGTPEYDKLFKLRPLLDTLTTACKSNYHPKQNISIDERMVARKAATGMTQYMKAKPTKWGFKLFVIADSSNGYTVDFSIYTGKSPFSSGVGLAYDTVMSLLNPSFLGSGYHLYVDNFYTSPRLFRDLHDMGIGACGTYRTNRKEFPKTQNNALAKKDPKGTIRWIREGPLVFVKWMDSREVSICSTIHTAFTGQTVKRRTKDGDGNWVRQPIPCPTPVFDYNKNMGGVDLSDQLIHYYTVHHTTMRWYRTLFFHFLDIAATNAYILHKELCQETGETPMTHRGFKQELTAQLCGVTVAVPPTKAHAQHMPVATSVQTEKSKRGSFGRKTCVHCRVAHQKQQSTPWKCQACDVALCLIADRNCFKVWHQERR